MKKHLLWLAAVLAFPLFTLAQNTPEQDLEKGVETYNAYKVWMEGYPNRESVTAEVYANGKERLRNAVQYLDKAINKGNADVIRAGRYFKANTLYLQGYLDAVTLKNKEAWTVIKPLKTDFEYWSDPNLFPVRYVYFGQNYSVKYENFAPTLMEFYNAYAELNEINDGPAEESYLYYQKVVNSSYSNTWDKYIAFDKIAAYETKNDPNLLKLPNTLLAQLYIYYSLGEKSKQTIKDNNYPGPKTIVPRILSFCKRTPAITNRGNMAGETATLVAENSPRDDNDALQLYQIAVKDNVYTNEALNFAISRQTMSNIETAITPSSVKELAGKLGTDILDLRYSGVLNGSDCAAMETLAAQYQTLGNTTRAAELRSKKTKCDEALAKKQRRASKQFNIYAGIYPIPLFGSSEKRDVGGHVDFVFTDIALSFGYATIQYRNDLNFLFMDLDDDYRWDGYRTRFMFKKFRKGTGAYSGFVLGYAEKNHYIEGLDYRDVIISDVNDKTTGLPVAYNERFETVDRQYEIMFVTGAQFLAKVIGTDFSIGIGGTINEFDGGNKTYWSNPDVEIVDQMINSRKEINFYPQIFLNWSIGINFGKSRM